ncbi:flagellar hook-associated protein FlgL [Limnohabitans sp. 63ED37-2]|uniref:flagellar hook-associated protein FlgL n=1 Tax=Limnohabitans sp. 63ED37-2 TaxID=1678128 RepID=UPI000705F559|nr:flagellar hook-associated protein FlgL [Limnohabitans sp. 63ED37-2]ALK88956.1 Flagellar hook-associated protein 3 [Limnohabitans sp. 63ED37-2]
MKISTSFLFDRATDRMSTIQNKLATTQAQLSVSKQILKPSDAPDQAAAIQRLKGEVERQNSHVRTLEVAMRRYGSEETVLKASNDLLIRMKELGLQAANGTMGQSDRDAVAIEMKALRNQLLSLGNTRDDSGNYLFSGTRVNTPAFAENANGQVVYMGDQTQTRIPAGVERTVQFTRAGTDVFSRVVRDGQDQAVGFFDALDQMIEGVETSDTTRIQQGLADVTQMHNNITLTQAQNGSDQKVVQSQMDILDETALRMKSTLSEIEDLDYAEAVTRMNKEMMALEAAMGSFAKISGLSLFDYIRG